MAKVNNQIRNLFRELSGIPEPKKSGRTSQTSPSTPGSADSFQMAKQSGLPQKASGFSNAFAARRFSSNAPLPASNNIPGDTARANALAAKLMSGSPDATELAKLLIQHAEKIMAS